MKQLLILILILIVSPAYAQPSRGGSPATEWRSVDGNVIGRARTIVVSQDVISFDATTMSLDVASIRPFVNGSFKETIDALVTSDGATITLSIEQSGGGDLTMQFSDGQTTLDCTPTATIALTAGTTTSPQGNYVYVLKSTKALTLSTSAFPTTVEHIKVGYFLVGSATYVQAEGAYINQNWNDHLKGTDQQGHMLDIAERARRSAAKYFSGVGPNGTDQLIASSYFDYVGVDESYFKSASGVVYQLHRHAYPAKDTREGTDDLHIVNQLGDNYAAIHKINTISLDAVGATLGNRYFNVTFFGVANKSGEYGPVMVNLPTGSYANQVNAEQDSLGYDVFSMPREFNLESSTGFLICRMTLRYTGGLGTLNHVSTVDLRGQTPSTATGGASGTTTNFADNQFTIFDETDSTKIMDFDVGTNVPTATTYTITMTNRDLSLLDPTFNTVSVDTTLTVSGDAIVAGTGTFGGTSAGQSTIDSGLVVNEAGGNAAADDFRAETANEGNALVVDASADEIIANVDLVVNDITILTPSAAQAVTVATYTILANATFIFLNPDADRTLTSTPTIAAGSTGQLLYITCADAEPHTVTLQDEGTLGGSGLELGGATRSIRGKDILVLLYTDAQWTEVSYSQNF